MRRKIVKFGPHLKALMDERDDLHIKISLASDSTSSHSDDIHSMQLRLALLDREILKSWSDPSA